MIDWRVMFAKYVRQVVANEGVHFLNSFGPGFTDEEWAAIVELYDEEFIPDGWRSLL